MAKHQQLDASAREALLTTLQARFERHPERHKSITWATVAARLAEHPGKLWPLQQMELSGGEPDVTDQDAQTGTLLFCDCSAESPKGRRSLCYDEAALASRKEHKPADSVIEMARVMGIELLDEAGYRRLQELGAFDLKSSSWIATPPAIRELGGALFCDRRYNKVFVYHNGAESYYAARGFRGCLRV